MLRFDRDRIRRKGVMDEQLEHVLKGEPCLMVGTQMLAKGHHFPGVTLVVIVNIDQALYSADFRALERMGQMMLQVAGRAGRMEKAGTVILQTLHPEHAALELLSEQWIRSLRALVAGRAQDWPDCRRRDTRRCCGPRRMTAPWLSGFLTMQALHCFPQGEARIYGPMPAIMERVGGRSRMYLVVQGQHRMRPAPAGRPVAAGAFARCHLRERSAGRWTSIRRIYQLISFDCDH